MTTRTSLATMLTILSLLVTTVVLAQNSGKVVVMPVKAANKSLDEGANIIGAIISDYFAGNHAVQIITSAQQESLIGEDTGNRLQLIRTITTKLASDQALLFTLNRYQERAGDQYSVEDPASLAFEFKLINSADGRVLCSGRFDETQQPLTDNILALPLAIKRGFKWLTVKDMATAAVRERFDTCPALSGKSNQ